MITHLHCTVCPDLQKAKLTLSNMQRINIMLNQYVKQNIKFNPEYKIRSMQNDKQHLHFMCGNCVKFNDNALRRTEREIHDAVYSICCNIKDGLLSDHEIINVLHLLAGYYPTMHKEITRQWYLKRKETEVTDNEQDS